MASQHVLCGPFESGSFVGSVSSKLLLCAVQTSFALFTLCGHLLWWCKGSVGETAGVFRESRQWCQTVRLVTVFFIIMHVEFLKNCIFTQCPWWSNKEMMNIVKPRNVCWNVRYFRDVQWLSWGEETYGIVWVTSYWPSPPCHSGGIYFLDSWKHNLSIWQTFSQTWMQKLVLRKTADGIDLPNGKIWAFSWSLNFGKPDFATMAKFLNIKTFLIKISEGSQRWLFKNIV